MYNSNLNIGEENFNTQDSHFRAEVIFATCWHCCITKIIIKRGVYLAYFVGNFLFLFLSFSASIFVDLLLAFISIYRW